MRWAIRLAITLVMAGLVEWLIGWRTVLAPWGGVPLWPALGALALLLLSYGLRAARVFAFFHEIPRDAFTACLSVTVVHNFYNNLLPMRAGELSFPILMSRRFGIDARKSSATLVWMRLLDLVAIGLIGLAALAVVVGLSWLALAIVALGVAAPRALSRGLRWLAGRMARAIPRMGPHLDVIATGFPASARDIRVFWWLSVANWAVKLVAFVIVFRWFMEVPAGAALFAVIGAEATSILPIHSLAGFGSYEAGAVAALALLGLSGKEALAAAVNLHLFVIGTTLATGLIALALGPRPNG